MTKKSRLERELLIIIDKVLLKIDALDKRVESIERDRAWNTLFPEHPGRLIDPHEDKE